MADLDIKKKKSKKPVLWAVLAFIAVVAIIWIVADDNDDEVYMQNEEVVTESETWGDDSGTRETNYKLDNEAKDAIDKYDQFTADLGAIEMDHETSHKGITLLADALAALSTNTQNEVEELRQQADKLLENRTSDEHAGIMHDAFVTAANIIEKQTANSEALSGEANDVMEAARAVDSNVLVTNQKDAIKNFFDKAANALNSLK